MSIVCATADSCDALAQQTALPFVQQFPATHNNTGCACQLESTDDRMARAAADASSRSSSIAVARAHAFWSGCQLDKNGKAFTRTDMRSYFRTTWQPGSRLGGVSCASMTRFGPPLGKDGDGGKTLCNVAELLRSPDCLVVSVGLNDDTRFEEHLHRSHPECEIVGMDGTLTAEKAAKVPRFIRFEAQNFDEKTYAKYVQRRRVSLLKIDCDGCEYRKLRPWLQNVCTEQVVIEMHRRTFDRPYVNARNIHTLMNDFHAAGFRIAFLEPNPLWPKLGTEYTMVRNTTCK